MIILSEKIIMNFSTVFSCTGIGQIIESTQFIVSPIWVLKENIESNMVDVGSSKR